MDGSAGGRSPGYLSLRNALCYGGIPDDSQAVGGIDSAACVLSCILSAERETLERNRDLSCAGDRDGAAFLYQKRIVIGLAGLSFYPNRSV